MSNEYENAQKTVHKENLELETIYNSYSEIRSKESRNALYVWDRKNQSKFRHYKNGRTDEIYKKAIKYYGQTK